jgi:hypothetical protein
MTEALAEFAMLAAGAPACTEVPMASTAKARLMMREVFMGAAAMEGG